jgi:CheY-like chemotaxis protein
MNDLAKKLPLNILVAEDNFINQKLIRDILALQGYECDAVTSGIQTLDAITKKKYDLILMDIQMPGMGGEEAMQKIQKIHGKDSPKIIALTAHAMADDRQKFISIGMDGYISKPFRIKELMSEIMRVMEKE